MQAFMNAVFSIAENAEEMGVYTYTICRELRSNRSKKGYCPKQAHAMAVDRRTKANKLTS
jgi:IS30 family transposase